MQRVKIVIEDTWRVILRQLKGMDQLLLFQPFILQWPQKIVEFTNDNSK